MTEELNDSNAVATINVIAEVPTADERAVSLALLESFGSSTVRNLCHKFYSRTQVELCHLECIVALPQLRSTVSRKAARK